MEYKSEEGNGDSAWYKLVGDRNIPVKVSMKNLPWPKISYAQPHGIAGSFAGIFKIAVRFYNELNTKYCRFLHKIN